MYDKGEYAQAFAVAEKAVEASPKIGNRQQFPPGLFFLMGDALVGQSDCAKALTYYVAGRRDSSRFGLDTDIALCHAMLGHFNEAKEQYSVTDALRFDGVATARDLPGTASLRSLQASLLAAKGALLAMSSHQRDALTFWLAAGKLAQQNAYIARGTAAALRELDRSWEAEPFYETAVRYGQGVIKADAQARLDNLVLAKKWRGEHGLPAVPPAQGPSPSSR